MLIGIDQDMRPKALSEAGERAGIEIRHGTMSDGAGYSTVAEYLSSGTAGTVSRFHGAPVLRIIGPSTPHERGIVFGAVEAVNRALPPGYKIQMGADQPGMSFRNIIDDEGYIYYPHPLSYGTIYIEFLPCAEYFRCGRAAATAWSLGGGPHSDRWSYTQFAQGTVSHNDPWQGRILMAHELLHAIGMDEHVSQDLDSIVRARHHYDAATDTILSSLDREGIQALYGRLKPGDDPMAFGPWSRTSVHLLGDGRHADFGVAWRNGYAEPWASGALPRGSLRDNGALTDAVQWSGALVGLTPAAEPVTGDAAIVVDLLALTGSALFTGLESWAPRAAPGAAGTGATWLDGDLVYAISVTGNTFREIGGDDGRLRGTFTGREHHGAAGTLERADLTAAFGASR